MNNPDYPTPTGVNAFLMHTYRPEATAHSYYYNGGAINPFMNNNGYGNDSRRNQQMYNPNQQPINPFTGYPTTGYPQPQQQQSPANPESLVAPYSSYPPAYTPPQQNTSMFGGSGLNSLIESRRNAGGATTNGVVNPWATNQNTPQFAPPQPQQPQFNPFANPYAQMYTGYTEPAVSALYNNNPVQPFDRKGGCWENIYSMNRPLPIPNIDWRQDPMNNSYANPYTQQPQQPVFPQVNQYPDNPNWEELAKRNWAATL